MIAKKESAPRGNGLTVPGVIAILTGLVSLTIFLTGKTTLPEILGRASATVTATKSPSPTAPAATTTPALTETPTATIVGLPFSAQPATSSDLTTIDSIWTLTHYRDLAAPGSQSYTVTVRPDSTWLWDWSICATTNAFQNFLTAVSVELLVDGTPLTAAQYWVHDSPGAPGWLCRQWVTKLSGWPRDGSLFLEARYTQSRKENDGNADYEAGEYRQMIAVVVQE